MRVKVEAVGLLFRAKILDGYRAGEFILDSNDRPIFDVIQDRFANHLREIGYEVVDIHSQLW